MDIKECRECGSKELYWSPNYRAYGDVAEGRLRTNEVRAFFVLGCDTCCATLKVISADDAAEMLDEAQALREEVAALRLELGGMQMEMAEVAYRLSPALLTELKRLVAFAYDQGIEGAEEAGRQLEGLLGQEALRERVVVVPERKGGNAPTPAAEGFNACLDELARLNGKAVSEGLLRKWLELMEHGDFSEGHCMCGSAVDSHGIGDGHAPVDAGEYYVGQVMEELRALLDEGKEAGNA